MYSDKISINKNFQSSINLDFDLGSAKKISEYIPTSDICDVLKIYIKAFLYDTNDKATILVGPYGKGKTFLLLVLSYLAGQKKKDKTYLDLIEKIKCVDSELYKLIKEYEKKKLSLLPVIISSNYDNINQAFMIALNDALNREKITNVVPKTVYSVCVELITKWEKDKKHNADVISVCEKKFKTSLRDLKRGLQEYSEESYEKFRLLYNCVTTGLEFNPLINNDIVSIYSDVNNELSKHGYSGMLVIFDEFSKFIEGSSTLMHDLKTIQDFAEKAVRSDHDRQLHLCCVTHKSLDLYHSGGTKTDAFKTVEGRFKEIKFNRSLEENYQIISAAIRNEKCLTAIKNYIKKNEEFYSRVSQCQPFVGQDYEELFSGCFPLNPITVYSLIQLSEIVAQNERTLFTFICDTDDNSFNSFVRNNDFKNGLFNVDKIYDYFSSLLQKEERNSIRSIWYRTEATLSRVEDIDERRMIKALSVILMIGDNDRFAPSLENLSLAIGISSDSAEAVVQRLIEKHYLRQNIINGFVSFATSNSKEIEEQIQLLIKTRAKSFSIDEIAEEIDDTKYVLPRRHNEENKISRYYNVVYITDDELDVINSFDLLHERFSADGLLVRVIRRKQTVKRVEEKVRRINDPKTIVCIPAQKIDKFFDDELLRYASLKEIIKAGNNDQVVQHEIYLLLEEVKENVQELFEQYYSSSSKYISAICSAVTYPEILSDVMDENYTKEIVFNNELVNKHSVTTQYQKSINNVVDWMINGEIADDWNYSETSPENTVKISIVEKINNQQDARSVVDEIKDSIIKSGKSKLSIADLVMHYTESPFGIREGIIPILIGKAISELSDNVILYFQDKEIELISENLNKAVSSKGKYYITFSKGSKEQNDYLYDMLGLFDAKIANNFRMDTKILSNELRKFFVGLPMIIRSCSTADNYLSLDKSILDYKDVFLSFDINPFETVFIDSLSTFNTDKYKTVYKMLSKFVKRWSDCIEQFKKPIISNTKNLFDTNMNTSIKMGMKAYFDKHLKNEKPILNDRNNNIYTTALDISYDDSQASNELSYACLGVYIEDWSIDRREELREALEGFVSSLTSSDRVDTQKISVSQMLSESSVDNISSLGQLLNNNIQSIFEEYGDSVSSEEKIAILTNLLSKYLK